MSREMEVNNASIRREQAIGEVVAESRVGDEGVGMVAKRWVRRRHQS